MHLSKTLALWLGTGLGLVIAAPTTDVKATEERSAPAPRGETYDQPFYSAKKRDAPAPRGETYDQPFYSAKRVAAAPAPRGETYDQPFYSA